MGSVYLIIIYGLMLAFDLSVLVGTAYLISEKQWSPWWMLVAIIVCTGSNPRSFIDAWKGGAA